MARRIGARGKARLKGLETYRSTTLCKDIPERHNRTINKKRVCIRDVESGRCVRCMSEQYSLLLPARTKEQTRLRMARYRANVKARSQPTILDLYRRSFQKELTAMVAKSEARQHAIETGKARYVSHIACQVCDGNERYTANGACVECLKNDNRRKAGSEAGRAAAAERQARYRARQAAKKNDLLDDI